MLQIKTFELPAQESEANEFLRTHKPTGEIARMGDLLFIAFEDGTFSPEYQIAELKELLAGNRNAKLQQEIALHVMEYELADLHPNQKGYDELQAGIRSAKESINRQDVKAAFVEKRIEQLTAGK